MTAAFVDGDLSWELPGVWMLEGEPHRSSCRSCQQPILWARNAGNDKRAPFDPLPAGAVMDGQAVSSSHWGTCPARREAATPVDSRP